MFCRKCGKQILDDSNFCQYCGTEVRTAEELPIEKTILLSKQEAKLGTEKEIELNGVKSPLKITFPPNVANGQSFRLHNVKTVDIEGKKIKRDIYIKVEIKA